MAGMSRDKSGAAAVLGFVQVHYLRSLRPSIAELSLPSDRDDMFAGVRRALRAREGGGGAGDGAQLHWRGGVRRGRAAEDAYGPRAARGQHGRGGTHGHGGPAGRGECVGELVVT